MDTELYDATSSAKAFNLGGSLPYHATPSANEYGEGGCHPCLPQEGDCHQATSFAELDAVGGLLLPPLGAFSFAEPIADE